MGTTAEYSHSSITYRNQEGDSEQTDRALPPGRSPSSCLKEDHLPVPSVEDEPDSRVESLEAGGPARERRPDSGDSSNGEKRMEERISRRRTNRSCDGGGEREDTRFRPWAPGKVS